MSLAALKQRIAEILDPPRTEAAGLPTGIAALDALLSDGGVPRGRLTEVVGPRGGGKTTFARGLVERAIRARHWVAYIDAARTLAPADWTHVRAAPGARDEALWVVRPRDPARAAWCADVLLRSGAFALVVLDGAPPLTRAVAVRLAQCAREADAAFLILADESTHAGSTSIAVRLRIARRERLAGAARRAQSGGESPITLRITVEKGGGGGTTAVGMAGLQTVEVGCAIGLARRLCADPAIPDRRGVAPTRGASDDGESGSRLVPGAKRRRDAGSRDEYRDRGDARGDEHDRHTESRVVAHEPIGRSATRKRRCAEPDVEHESFLGALR